MVAGVKTFRFHLHLTSEQCLDYYRGAARAVIARCANGQTVQFPANMLHQMVTPEGVHGLFILTCDDQNKVVSLERASGSR